MNPPEALHLLAQAAAQARLTLEEHQRVQQAVHALGEFITVNANPRRSRTRRVAPMPP